MRNKSIFLSIIILIGISVIGINQSFAQTDVEIPPWVKGVANFWVEDKIDDGEFAEALEFLIDSDIIQLGNTEIMSESTVDWEKEYYKSVKEHSALATEMDEKYNNLKKQTDAYVKEVSDGIDIEKKEWRETYNKISEENTKLKAKIEKLK